MSTNTEHQSFPAGTNVARPDPSELLPSLQSLLAALATIDFEHESDIETIRNSSVDEWMRQITIRKLQERYRERRTPYVRQLAALQKRVQTAAA
jgi:hypothetical protein